MDRQTDCEEFCMTIRGRRGVRAQNKWSMAVMAVVVTVLGVGPAVASEIRSEGPEDQPGPIDGSCTAESLLFCEDFEALPVGEANSPDWGVDLEGGTLTVEREPVGGDVESEESEENTTNQVLHVRTDDNGRARLVVENFAAPDNSFFGRVRLRVDALPTAPDFAHYVFVEATGPEPGSEIVRPLGGQFIPLDEGGGENRLGIGADGGPTGDWTDHRESAPAAEGQWQCFEWEMDASDNRIAVLIDGVDNPELTVSTDQHGGNPVDFVFPTFDTVSFGWQLFQADPTPPSYDVLMDDIALGTERVGC